ncbi:Fimbrial assembly protein (PilN) [Nitrosomonas sp. Nm51]|uniref:PilN domain-containing protein n=1 Tax=Nitrosomonas sp. Nm51 TaxID=133720 RepID=UPI0008C49E0A|nr:PilN domain-containing protein [Nitrosomonas sp. Nm51]SEQ99857.1 Fimbrial assembly protein (PilN) [Nitrosomonas sp. Nm51]
MSRLKLSFPYSGQQVRSIDITLLCVGLIAVLFAFYQFRQIAEESGVLSARVERLEKQQSGTAAATRSRSRATARTREFSQEISKELQQANVIMGQINLPWEALFDAIEHIITEDVALLALQPNVTNRVLRISGEARNMGVLLDFIEAMEREAVFEKTHLVNYKIKQDNPYRPVDFLLTTVWTTNS